MPVDNNWNWRYDYGMVPMPRSSSGSRASSSLGSSLFGIGASLGTNQPTSPGASPGAPGSPLDDLFQKLLKSMSSGYNAPSQQSLRDQAMGLTSSQFDPQIAALRRAAANAKSNATYSKAAIGKLFTGLADSYKVDQKNTKKLFNEAKASENERLKSYQDNVKDNYKDSMQSLADSFNQLGIQAAAGESTTGALAKDESFNLQQAADESNIEQGALNQEALGENVYWQKGAGTAKMEGTQRQGDLEMMLNQYLTDNSGKIADLEAQREVTYRAALAKLQQDVADQATKQQNDTWSQLLQLGNFQMSVGKYNQSMNSAASKPVGKGLTGANNYLVQQFQNSQWGVGEAQRYADVLQSIVLQIPAGVSAEEAAGLAASEANRRGISASVLSKAMLAYYGKL